MKTIRILVNPVFTGWTASDLEKGVGGSEEKLIEMAKALSKDYDITIYHNGEHGVFDNVKYKDYRDFKPYEFSDIFISFKSKQVLTKSINSDKIIHWTTDIETWKDYELNNLDKIITISDFHLSRMTPRSEKMQKSYLWADFDRLDKNRATRHSDEAIYTSSYDRGLEEVLQNWSIVSKELGIKKLKISYGWQNIDMLIKNNPYLGEWKKRMLELMNQKGIVQLGLLSNNELCKEYWKSKYWILPCNNPNGELFCISAVKAEYCECIPVVRRIGGLQETVNQFIDWDHLIKTGEKNNVDIKANKDFVKDNFDYKKQIQEWKKILESEI